MILEPNTILLVCVFFLYIWCHGNSLTDDFVISSMIITKRDLRGERFTRHKNNISDTVIHRHSTVNSNISVAYSASPWTVFTAGY